MVAVGKSVCPNCGDQLKYYDTVKRIVRTKYRVTEHIDVRRLRCEKCHSLHRELPDTVFPFKQYDSEIIKGVLEGLIDYQTLGFEDFPCEMTMKRWLSQKMQLLLWK